MLTIFLFLLFTSAAQAQASQFLFDPNGNLFVQTAAVTAPPQILGQPQSRIVAPGESAPFSVVAADTRALSYQWRFNGIPLGGSATNDAMVLQNVSTNQEGEYRVVLTNPSGSVTSAPAFLMIDSDADGVADSWELTYFTNLTATATADLDGDGVSNLQEFLDNTNPTNSVSARYRLQVLRDGGSVIKTPDQASYTNGESVTLTAIASANDTFHAWLGDIVTRSNPVTLVMTNNQTVYARFTPIVFTWTNRFSGNWESATNWTPNLVPAANDNACIAINTTVTLNGSDGCLDLLLGSAASNPVLTGSGTLTVHGNSSWISGTMSGSGKTLIAAGAALDVANPNGVTLTSRFLENSGTVLWTGAGGMTLFSGAVITNQPGALFHVQNAALVDSSGSGIRFDNAGMFRKSVHAGTSTLGNSVSFNNSGTVEIQSGTLLCNGGFTNNGTVNLSPGATNRLAGGGSASGTFNASATALVEWTGNTFMLEPGAQLNGAGLYKINSSTLTRNADLTVDNLDLAVGTLSVTGTLTIANAMNWTSGTMRGSGRTIVAASAILNVAVPSLTQASLENRTLENGGTVVWTGVGSFALNFGAVFTNRAGALFNVQNAASLQANVGVARLDNAGIVRKSANIGTAAVGSGVSFNNSGVVDVQSGTLLCDGAFNNNGMVSLSAGATNRLAGGGSASGTFNAAATALVEWTGGTFTLDAGAQLNGAGLYRINLGTVTANTNIALENLDLINGALTGASRVTVNNLMNWTGGTMGGSGRTVIPAGVTLNLAPPSSASLNTRTLENGGTVLWTGPGFIGVTSGAVITNRAGGLFHIRNAVDIGGGIANGRMDNAGMVRKSVSVGTTTFASGMALNNFGAVEVQTGTLLCNGSLNNNGTVKLSAGTTNRAAGGGSGSGAFDTSATALVEWTGGTFTLNTGAQLNGTGLYRINGIGATLVGNANVSVENLDLVNGSSTLGGTGTVTVASTMNWTAGAMGGGGRTIIQNGATLNLAPLNSVSLNPRTLENAGTVLWTGAGSFILLNGIITNRGPALFHARNDATFSFGGGGCRFDNAGIFLKSSSTATSTVPSGVPFTNYGTVNIRSGTLAANGGYVSSSNALLSCALGGTDPGTGYGRLLVAGTVTLNGALRVDLTNGFFPALNDSFTVLIAATRNGTFGNFSYPSNTVAMQLSNAPNSVIVRVTEILAAPAPALLPPELSGSGFKLIWTAVSNTTYRVEFNPDLAPAKWTALPGDVIGISNTASKLDPLTPSNRLYRVRVLP